MKDFEYKTGDKVRCKKFYKNKHYQFYNGSTYEIDAVYPLFDTEVIGERNTFSATTKIVLLVGKVSHTFKEKEFYQYFYSRKGILNKKLRKLKKIKFYED